MTKSEVLRRGFESKFCMGRAIAQAIPSAVWTQVLYDNIIYDLLNECRVAPNADFIPVIRGLYLLVARMRYVNIPINTDLELYIDINGGNYGEILNRSGVALKDYTSELTLMRELEAGDVVTVITRQNSGAPLTFGGHVTSTTFMGLRIG